MMADRNIISGIQHYLEVHQGEMLNFLRELVTIETPSGELGQLHLILAILKDRFKAIGFHTLLVRGTKTAGYLYARPKNRDKGLPLQLLVGHCDTVWPMDTLRTMPIRSSGNKIKGPGIFDMKVGLAQIIFALRAIEALSLPMRSTPIVLINSDEEIGSRESTRAIKRLAQIADRAYVLEPPFGPEGKLKTARKGLGRFTITVKGKAAHAGLDPSKGVNAIVELSHQIQKLFAMNDPERGITVNVGMIEGGISANVVAPESRAVVDVRVLKQTDGDYITEKIKGLKPFLADVQLHIEGGIGRPPMETTERNRELWKVAKGKARKMGLELGQTTAGGGSDANTTSQFTATLDGLGTPGDGAHAAHEYILKNKLIERTTLLTLLLLAEPLNPR